MSAACQIVATAIDESVQQDRIVTVDVGPSGLVCCGGGVTGERVKELLGRESDDCVEASARVTEYWGTDCHDRPWRVHVRTVSL